jgi:transmembrane protein EpsG
MLALSVMCIAYRSLLHEKYILYIILTLFAITFHISALILLPIPLLLSCRYTISKRTTIVLYFSLYILLTPTTIKFLLDTFLPWFSTWLWFYYERILTQDFHFFSIGKLFYCFLFVLITLNREYIIDQSMWGKKIYSLTIISFFLLIVGYALPTFFRLALYVSPFLYISLSWVLTKFYCTKKLQPICLLIIMYFLFARSFEINRSYIYKPYSNYLTYIFRKKPSYEERYNYNYMEYYKRTGKYPDNFKELEK